MGFLVALGYAVSGALAARRQGESVEVITFAKTLAINLATQGLLSQTTADATTQLIGSVAGTITIDQIVNAILDAFGARGKVATPTTTTPATTPAA